MNKKVLSAILFSALFAGTGTFTSCIDNDEPAGIEELRGAKAELLRAKVAVEQAEASFKLAQAEVEKAKAAKQAALAKQAEATARLWEAQAEAEEAKTAQAKAAAEAAIDSIQRELEKAQVAHETTMLTQKQSLAEAQRTYEVAMKQIEIAKALMSESQKVEISSLMKDVKDLNDSIADQQVKIDARYADLKDASLIFDLDSAFEVRKAETALKVQKAALDAQVEKIAKYKKYLDNDSTLDVSAWREEIAKIEKEIAEYEKQLAVFKVDSAKAMNGAERKALDKAIADAKAALKLEQDSLGLKLEKDIKDTLLYYGSTQDDKVTINIVADGNKTIKSAVEDLAGSAFMTAEDSLDYTGILANLRAEYNSYTTERIYWLDSIKNLDAAAVEAASKKVDAAVKAWEDSLAAYNAAKNVTAPDIKTAAETFIAALNATGATVVSKKTAAATFATALTTAYNALPAGQVAYNKIKLQDPAAPTDNTKTKENTIVGFLGDAANQYHNLVYALGYFGLATPSYDATTGVLDVTAVTGKTKDDYQTAFATPGAAATTTPAANAKSVLASLIQKEILNETTGRYTNANFDANGYGVTLLGKLINASKNAFGDASLYVNGTEMTGYDLIQNGYLLNKPTLDDVRHAVKTYEKSLVTLPNYGNLTESQKNGWKNVGIYGASLASSDAQVDFVANNHAAIKADLKAAIDKLTAYVDSYKTYFKKAGEDVEAAGKVVTAAGKALSDYAQKVKDDYDNATAELDAKLTYMRRMADDLGNAVKLYLADADVYNNYQGEKLFIDHLKSQLGTFESTLIDYEYAVAKAELYLQLTKDGDFASAKNVETIKDDIAALEAKMADYVKRLAEAVEKLATAEEIWYAAE